MSYADGFIDLEHEHSRVRLTPIAGQIPAWLRGTLLRNGPGRFSVGEDRYRHWFDGLAMLHGFYFEDGAVFYSNRFLRSPAYCESMESNKIRYNAFATVPRYNRWQALLAWFAQPQSGANNGVSIARLGSEYLALTEAADIVACDAATLETGEVIEFDDDVSGEITTAHPHYDFARRNLINFNVKLGRRPQYIYYTCDSTIRQRRRIGAISVDKPAYTHSFAMTEHYIVHVEFPLVVHPLRLRFGNVPYINCYRWDPARGTRFTLLRKSDGAIVKHYQTAACFAFHHVNAFERNDAVVVDIAAKPDASVIDDLYLDHLRSCTGRPIHQPSTLQRFVLPLTAPEVTQETLCDEYLEMPVINYRRHNGRDYRITYGISARTDRKDDFENQLIRIDTLTGAHSVWYEDDCYPWEPVFVARNPTASEDDGVLLSVVLNRPGENSYLLILDANTMQELARLALPCRVPLGFHGQFFAR